MKLVLAFVIGTCLAIAGFWYRAEIAARISWDRLPVDLRVETEELVSPLGQITEVLTGDDLDSMSFDALRDREFEPGEITLVEVLSVEESYVSYVFSYEVDGRTVTGMANIPEWEEGDELMPVIVMLRGFVDPSWYQTGIGTRNGAAKFAEAGFITLAPDFLGYGSSDEPEADVFWERFHKVPEILQLLANVGSVKGADPERVGIWGHSNGGQLALSVLQITGKPYPTTLWAPVSKPFPYSILYYTDEYDDGGKDLRKLLARLEEKYDVEKYSIGNYWEWIEAPIVIHQGTADDAIPVEWSRELTIRLRELEVDVNLYEYPGADHNLDPAWDTVVGRDVRWFEEKLSM